MSEDKPEKIEPTGEILTFDESVVLRLNEMPIFPTAIRVGSAEIKLNADGTWEGDREKYFEELAKLKDYSDPYAPGIAWLVANAIRKEG